MPPTPQNDDDTSDRSWASAGYRALEQRAGDGFARLPTVWRIPGLELHLGPTSTNAPGVPFTFPTDRRVLGLLVTTTTGDASKLAFLELAIEDNIDGPIVTDGRSSTPFAPARALFGASWRWFRMNRLQRAGSIWTFIIKNNDVAVGGITPRVFLRTAPAVIPGAP